MDDRARARVGTGVALAHKRLELLCPLTVKKSLAGLRACILAKGAILASLGTTRLMLASV